MIPTENWCSGYRHRKMDMAYANVTLAQLTALVQARLSHLLDGAPIVNPKTGNVFGARLTGGNLAACGSSACGTYYQIDPAGNFSVIFTFTGGANGGRPTLPTIDPGSGNLFGVGINENTRKGVLFRLSPPAP